MRVLQIIDGAGGRSEVEDIIDLAEIERLADILLAKLESRLLAKMGDVLHSAGQQIVRTQNGMSIGQ